MAIDVPKQRQFHRENSLPRWSSHGSGAASLQGRTSKDVNWFAMFLLNLSKYSIYIYIFIYIPVIPARGGAEVALDLTIRPFSSFFIYRTCTLCAPCALALRELVVLLLFKNVTGVRPCCNAVATQHQANIFFTLHTALFTPCTSRFTLALHIPQLILSQIIWFLLTSCHLIWPLLISSHPF